jgi:hypothetical protein
MECLLGKLGRTMTADRIEIWACFATTAPGESAQALVTRARGSRSSISAFGIQTLLFLDPFTVDAAAADSSVHTKPAA